MCATIAVTAILEKRKTSELPKLQMAPLRTLAANDRGACGGYGLRPDTGALLAIEVLMADNRKGSKKAATAQQASMLGVVPSGRGLARNETPGSMLLRKNTAGLHH